MEQLPGSVTCHFKQLHNNDACAVVALWKRYFDQLARHCQSRLAALPSRAVSGEDVSLSALDSFFRRAKRGEFKELEDRKQLWSLLFAIAMRKTANVVKSERRDKRGGGEVVGESVLGGRESIGTLEQEVSKEPAPELVVALREALGRLAEK